MSNEAIAQTTTAIATYVVIAMANHNSQLARESARRWVLSQQPTKRLPSAMTNHL